MSTFPGHLHHRIPSWVKEGSIFHVRIRAAPEQRIPLTDPQLAPRILASARRNHELLHWWCPLVLLMPDHLHAMIVFPTSPGMSEAIRNWKRLTARTLQLRWQDNYFDHRIRTPEEAQKTWRYIRLNPVVKNLCLHPAAWPWWGGLPSTRLEAYPRSGHERG